MEPLKRVLNHVLSCKVLCQSRDELRLQPVLPDHKTIRACATVAVARTAVPHISPLPGACCNHHLRTADAADQETAEKVSPAALSPSIPAHVLMACESLSHEANPRLHSLPKLP